MTDITRGAAHWALDQVFNAAESNNHPLGSYARQLIPQFYPPLISIAKELAKGARVEVPREDNFPVDLHELRMEVLVRGRQDRTVAVKTMVSAQLPMDAITFSLDKMIQALVPHIKEVLDGKEE
ncbi:hypothetical protein SEA_TROJE_66 [Gordonia phage Troje]|uniref:Uncharacterized protein n=1 Tax=Gordonia phage Troje TaxID=2079282 RepID=A0A2K9VET9_9CAUD|nr:hypothetical protein FDJ27_gp66 [Gordonia phage Troje]AUV60771.1 hypothetical protein SEA_TROJE_66 [Gordonia phage Troje]